MSTSNVVARVRDDCVRAGSRSCTRRSCCWEGARAYHGGRRPAQGVGRSKRWGQQHAGRTWLSGNTATSFAPQRLVGRRRGTGVQFKLCTSNVQATAAPSRRFLLPLPAADIARDPAGVERPLSGPRIDADDACAWAAEVWGRAALEGLDEVDAAMLLGDRCEPEAGVPASKRFISSTLRRPVARGTSLSPLSSRSRVRPYCVRRGGCCTLG